jgi:DNA-binding NarL/FixJ family response regulator
MDCGAVMTTKIMVVDDHPIYLDGLELIFVDVVEHAELFRACSVTQAENIIRQHQDIEWIFLDQKLPDGSGLQFIKALRAAFVVTPVIMVSALSDIALIDACLQEGANGFIGKESTKLVYSDCLHEVEKGEIFLTPDIHKQLNHYRNTTKVEAVRTAEQLSPRQREILPLIMAGFSNQEISDTLSIALSTVKSHVTNLINALNCENRTHCAAEARRLGLEKCFH